MFAQVHPIGGCIETLKNKRILVIEDDITNLAIISTLLRHYECEVVGINPRFHMIHGKLDIYQVRRACPIDLILTDINLPNHLSGYEVIEQLRHIADLTHIPIVAVSAATPDEEIPRARAKGFQGFIAKPIRVMSFGSHIAAVLRGETVWLLESD
jgi:two-component system cell cycle response regulator DivK